MAKKRVKCKITAIIFLTFAAYSFLKPKIMEYKEMTLEEKLAIGMRSLDLKKAGQLEEAERVQKLIPLSPTMAKWCKDMIGPEFLIQQGFNLSEAEHEFGQDWLSR
jgi:hypothetical protein